MLVNFSWKISTHIQRKIKTKLEFNEREEVTSGWILKMEIN